MSRDIPGLLIGRDGDVVVAPDTALRSLARQQFLGAPAQEPPLLVVDREVPPEIEQGVLAHLAVDPLAFDQTEGEASGAVRDGSGCGLANEHAAILRPEVWRASPILMKMAL